MRKYKNPLLTLFSSQSLPAILLAIATFLAIVFKNSSLAFHYEIFLSQLMFSKSIDFWINDGGMAIFFLLVGLELKREFLEGQLSDKRLIRLPLIAAIGGMVMPALIYGFFNWQNPIAMKGWAIPCATDIAFALGVLGLLANRTPPSLKLILLSLAVLDDLASIIIIASFYTHQIHTLWLCGALICVFALYWLNRSAVLQLMPYYAGGICLWGLIYKSGIHPTLAGVLLGFLIPLKTASSPSPLKRLEHALLPFVNYLILPLFAFVNAGVSLDGLSAALLLQPITVGIMLGLFIGKQAGVFLGTVLGVKLGFCHLPPELTWGQYYGMALLTGIGFTMSLFIGTLSFENSELQAAMRLGVLLGSLLSGIVGYKILKCTLKRESR